MRLFVFNPRLSFSDIDMEDDDDDSSNILNQQQIWRSSPEKGVVGRTGGSGGWPKLSCSTTMSLNNFKKTIFRQKENSWNEPRLLKRPLEQKGQKNGDLSKEFLGKNFRKSCWKLFWHQTCLVSDWACASVWVCEWVCECASTLVCVCERRLEQLKTARLDETKLSLGEN